MEVSSGGGDDGHEALMAKSRAMLVTIRALLDREARANDDARAKRCQDEATTVTTVAKNPHQLFLWLRSACCRRQSMRCTMCRSKRSLGKKKIEAAAACIDITKRTRPSTANGCLPLLLQLDYGD